MATWFATLSHSHTASQHVHSCVHLTSCVCTPGGLLRKPPLKGAYTCVRCSLNEVELTQHGYVPAGCNQRLQCGHLSAHYAQRPTCPHEVHACEASLLAHCTATGPALDRRSMCHWTSVYARRLHWLPIQLHCKCTVWTPKNVKKSQFFSIFLNFLAVCFLKKSRKIPIFLNFSEFFLIFRKS